MRLKLLLPDVKTTEFSQPKKCPRTRCAGMGFYPRQIVQKKIVDTHHKQVSALRYQCAKCGCTFRVYPKGVNKKQTSMPVQGMAVMLYILGLSYGAVELVLARLGRHRKTSVNSAFQSAAEKVPGMKQKDLLTGYKAKAIGADVTSVRCNGKWVQIGISVDEVKGMVLSIDKLSGEDAEHLKTWLEPILDVVDADVMMTDDADGFKKVSDETGRSQQVCKSHFGRNTDALVDELSALIMSYQDHSLEVIGVSPEQALLDYGRVTTDLYKCVLKCRLTFHINTI